MKQSIVLDDLNLHNAERTLIEVAADRAHSMSKAAELLGVTRHAFRRRMARHGLQWNREKRNLEVANPDSAQ